MKQAEARALRRLQRAVEGTAEELEPGSPWAETLAALGEELRDGQPFFFKIALASSSRSISDTPVTSA